MVRFRRGRATELCTLATFLRRFKLVKRHPGHASHKPPEPDWEKLARGHATWNHVLIERLRQVKALLEASGQAQPPASLDILTPHQAASDAIRDYERWVEIETAAAKAGRTS